MIYIVIPVFNRKSYTRKCVQSLQKQTFREFEIIVVDDGSTDGTSEMIAMEFPKTTVLQGDGNLWWAGATNKGIEYIFQNRNCSATDFILTLNNDLEVPEEYLERLVANAKRYPKALLGSVSVDIRQPAYMDFCGIRWNEFTGKYHSKAKDFQYSYSTLQRKVEVIDSDLLPGRGTLIPVEVFHKIGLFDAVSFPQYAADEDFSLRARRSGWKLLLPANVYLRSHIAQTGVDTQNIRLNKAYFKELFFSIRSPLNLRIRYRFAMKNTRLKAVYFLFGLLRISLSLSKDFLLQNFRKFRIAK